MTDIGVYCRKEVLEHKKKDGNKADEVYCYWTFPRFGRMNVKEGDRFWVASEGQWRGFFTIHQTSDVDEIPPSEYDPDESGEIRFWSESWRPMPEGPRKPFQGFTYNVPLKRNYAKGGR